MLNNSENEPREKQKQKQKPKPKQKEEESVNQLLATKARMRIDRVITNKPVMPLALA